MNSSNQKAIWWIRRDLRLRDNNAAVLAGAGGRKVIPLFVLDPLLLNTGATKRIQFMYSGLRSLDSDLRKQGGRLMVKAGDPEQVVPAVSQEFGSAPVFVEEDYSPYARRRDNAVGKLVHLTKAQGLTVQHPKNVLTNAGSPFRVYSRFRTRWLELLSTRLKANSEVPVSFLRLDKIQSEPLPDSDIGELDAGESSAGERLGQFIANGRGLWKYGDERDRVDSSTTSSLSPYIRFGMISAGSLVDTAGNLISKTTEPQHALSVQRWLDELIWREFFQSAIYHFPESNFQSLRPEFETIEWNEDSDDLEAWKLGQTGYPIVDAAMRQLESVGWIHNRLRMIVASFLVKHLLIDWRVGAQWFMKKLIDGDLAANTGGWQWIAGTGLDASPYFRIFNPVLQGKKFDPNGTYVRTWIPEFDSVPDNIVHSPWEWTGRVSGYPMPVVDHAFARKRAIAAYTSARDRFKAN